MDKVVPCNGCSACCRAVTGVSRHLTIANPKGYQVYNHDGKWRLATKVNGDCVYLKGNKCSIYEERPNECRSFDCADLKKTLPANRIPPELKHAIAMRMTR